MKYKIYNIIVFLLPKRVITFLGSLKILENTRDWLFDRNLVLKPVNLISWNNIQFYFRAPLQILRKAKTKGIENSLTRSIIHLINVDSNVIDIGSNYGFITLACSKYIQNGGGKVFSFECDVKYFKNLESSILINEFDNIQLFNEFVGKANIGNTKTVDSLIFTDCKSLDLIKIDTDGTDLECLEGCRQIIGAYNPIIVIEINDNFDQITKFLSKSGYEFFYDQYLNKIDLKSTKTIPNLFSSKYSLKI